MGQFRYMTNRTLADDSGNETGRIRVLVRSGSDTAEGDYVCPGCKAQGKISQAWKRPFNVKCSGCGFLLRLPRLKGKKDDGPA